MNDFYLTLASQNGQLEHTFNPPRTLSGRWTVTLIELCHPEPYNILESLIVGRRNGREILHVFPGGVYKTFTEVRDKIKEKGLPLVMKMERGVLKLTIKAGLDRVKIEPSLATVLHLPSDAFLTNEDIDKHLNFDADRYLNRLIVHTDFTSSEIFVGARHNILTHYQKRLSHITPKTIDQSVLKDIHLWITDFRHSLVTFQEGRVIATLHFKHESP